MNRRRRSRTRLIGEHFRANGQPKRRFDTYAEAQAFAEQHGRTELLVYGPCDFCGGFHYATRRTPKLI